MWCVHTPNNLISWQHLTFSKQTSLCLFGVEKKTFVIWARNGHITGEDHLGKTLKRQKSTKEQNQSKSKSSFVFQPSFPAFRRRVDTEIITAVGSNCPAALVVRTRTAVAMPTHGHSTTTAPSSAWPRRNSRWVSLVEDHWGSLWGNYSMLWFFCLKHYHVIICENRWNNLLKTFKVTIIHYLYKFNFKIKI